MHILIPMSGAGRRFADVGYDKPKPFIEFFGKPMIEHVLGNLGHHNEFTLCVLKDHYSEFRPVFDRLRTQVSKLNIVLIDQLTQGAAETCLLAKRYIDPESPLMIANCDQMMKWDQKAFENWMVKERLDGAILVYSDNSTKCSYVEIDNNGLAVRTVEKQVISPYATNGIYVWDKGIDFVWAAERMISKNLRVNNEFYVCPVYNENIARGDRIGIWAPEEHYSIGTPDDLNIYIKAFSNENI